MSTCLGHNVYRYLAKCYFWMCLWGFLNEINIWISSLGKADCPPHVGGHHMICWRLEWNESSSKKKKEKSLCLIVFSRYIGALPSLDLDLEWNLYHHTIYTNSPGFPTCWLQILGFSASIITWAKSHSLTGNSYLSIYLSSLCNLSILSIYIIYFSLSS